MAADLLSENSIYPAAASAYEENRHSPRIRSTLKHIDNRIYIPVFRNRGWCGRRAHA